MAVHWLKLGAACADPTQ